MFEELYVKIHDRGTDAYNRVDEGVAVVEFSGIKLISLGSNAFL